MAATRKTYVVERRIVLAAQTDSYWFAGSPLLGGMRWVSDRRAATALSHREANEVLRKCRDAARAFGDYHHLYRKQEVTQ